MVKIYSILKIIFGGGALSATFFLDGPVLFNRLCDRPDLLYSQILVKQNQKMWEGPLLPANIRDRRNLEK